LWRGWRRPAKVRAGSCAQARGACRALLVAEIDRIVRLQAALEGYEVHPWQTGAPGPREIFVTATVTSNPSSPSTTLRFCLRR